MLATNRFREQPGEELAEENPAGTVLHPLSDGIDGRFQYHLVAGQEMLPNPRRELGQAHSARR